VSCPRVWVRREEAAQQGSPLAAEATAERGTDWPRNNNRKANCMKSKKYILLTAGAALLVLLGTAGSDEGKGRHKLGGAWIGTSPTGGRWTGIQTPLDDSGQTAALRVNNLTWDPNSAELMASLGGDTLTEGVGSLHMTGRDTSAGSMVGYVTAGQNPPQVVCIWVWTGTTKFVGQDKEVVDGTLDFYAGPANTAGLPNADVDGDGFPDPGVKPFLSFHYGPETARRAVFP